MKISGYIRTLRPIHITEMADKSSTGNNTTQTATCRVFNAETGKHTNVPGIKSTVFRGMLRHTASDMVTEHLLRQGIQIPIEVFNALRHGSTSGRISRDKATPAAFNDVSGHPLMGLFGGGPLMSGGKGPILHSSSVPLPDQHR